MFVGTLTQSTKSAKHSQFSLRAYKLFYQAIYVTLISSQELPLTVMIANRLGNFSYPLATSMVLCVRKVLPSFTYLCDILDFVSVPSIYSVRPKGLAVPTGIEPVLSDVTDQCFSQLNYGTMISVGRHPRTNLYTESAYRR